MANENIVTPHWQVPFTFTSDGNALEIEQGSDNEIQQSAYGILGYEPGQLLCDASFGITDQALKRGGTDLNAVRNVLTNFDDRIDIVIDRDPNWIQSLVDTVTLRRNITPNA